MAIFFIALNWSSVSAGPENHTSGAKPHGDKVISGDVLVLAEGVVFGKIRQILMEVSAEERDNLVKNFDTKEVEDVATEIRRKAVKAQQRGDLVVDAEVCDWFLVMSTLGSLSNGLGTWKRCLVTGACTEEDTSRQKEFLFHFYARAEASLRVCASK